MTDMKDKIALLTGAAGEIGVATAEALAARGATVVAVDLGATDWSHLQKKVPSAIILHADVTNESDWERVIKECKAKAGIPHMFFDNAGIEGHVTPLHETSLAAFQKVMAVNVIGVFLGLKHVIPEMIANGGGSVVNTSSAAGLQGSPGLAPYVSSKHAVVGMTRAAALEYGPKNVRINSAHPGYIDSRMMASLEEGVSAGKADAGTMAAKMDQNVPLGRHGRTEEVAALVAFLLSDAASYCHGGRYTADGGLTEV